MALVTTSISLTLDFVRMLVQLHQNFGTEPLPWAPTSAIVCELVYRIIQTAPGAKDNSVRVLSFGLKRFLTVCTGGRCAGCK
jgi:hypothetical protein